MMSRIVINTTQGSLSIDSSSARLVCRPRKLEMSYEGNGTEQIKLKNTPPVLRIDQTEAFASAGLKPMHRQTMDFYGAALQKGLESIGTIAREGMGFLRIEQGGNPIAEQASAIGMRDVRLTVRAMPSVPPDIEILRGNVDLEVTGGMQGGWEWIDSESEYSPASINIDWTPSTIEITVAPGIELTVQTAAGMGINVDEVV